MKKWAVAFLAAALAALAASFWLTNMSAPFRDRRRWRCCRTRPCGRRWMRPCGTSRRMVDARPTSTPRAMGIQGRVGNIAQDASGKLVLGVRDQDALYVFDPAQGQIVNHCKARGGLPAPRTARIQGNPATPFSSNGQLAIATGGGHAVALFDAVGRFSGPQPAGTVPVYQWSAVVAGRDYGPPTPMAMR